MTMNTKVISFLLLSVSLIGTPRASAWVQVGPTKSLILAPLKTTPISPRRQLQHTVSDSSASVIERVGEKVEAKELQKQSNQVRRLLESSTLHIASTVFAATVLTFALNNFAAFGPILASGFTALTSALLLPEKFALAALCGSFAGMARTAVIPSVTASMALGVLSAAAMTLFNWKSWLIGMGGRLGFIAQCACTTQFLVSMLFIKPGSSAALVGSYPRVGKLLWSTPAIAFFTVFGAFFMTYWKETIAEMAKNPQNSEIRSTIYKRLSTSVSAVAATGILGSLLLPPAAAGPAFCGSFIAMSAPSKLPTYGAMLGAALLGGIWQQSLAGVLVGGWGGKLGTAALLGVLSYSKLENMVKRNLEAERKKPNDSALQPAVQEV